MKNISLLFTLLLLTCAPACTNGNEFRVSSTDQNGGLPNRVELNFDSDTIGSNASGFTASTGTWRVVKDPSARSGERVMAQVALNENGVFNVLLADSPSLKDVDISVQLRSIAGVVDQGGGVIWRAQDENNYYVARFNPLEDNYRIYYVKDGERTTLASATVVLDGSVWHSVKVVMRGDHIECYLDGEKHLDVRDAVFSGPGRLGLWTKADAQTYFDDYVVKQAAIG